MRRWVFPGVLASSALRCSDRFPRADRAWLSSKATESTGHRTATPAGCPRSEWLGGNGDIGATVDMAPPFRSSPCDRDGHPPERSSPRSGPRVGRAADRVRRALKPVLVVVRLFGGQDLHEALAEKVHPVRLADMAIERCRVELRQHENPPDVRVQAVADGDVNQPVFAANRHRRLGTVLGEREKAFALSAAEDDRQNLAIDSHSCARF